PSTADGDARAERKVLGGVSMAALLRRSRTLGVMPEGAYVQALKTMSTRGWNRREPVRLLQPETPVMLTRAAQLLNQSGATIDQLADEVGLPRTLVTEIVSASTDPRPEVRLCRNDHRAARGALITHGPSLPPLRSPSSRTKRVEMAGEKCRMPQLVCRRD